LNEILAKENLRLPIDVPQADRATLGGVLATNVSGSRRYGYGTLRDYVIGIAALNDEGREFKAGGRVVKNVAGYDLCKLLVGSLGTLGVITQVTLKLRPLAEQEAVVLFPCDAAEIEPILSALHESRTRPVCIDLLNRAAAQHVFQGVAIEVPDTPWFVIAGYEGNADAVGWQVQEIVKESTHCRHLHARVDFTAAPIFDGLCEALASPRHPISFRANMLPSATAAFCIEADRAAGGVALQAHAANGIVVGQWPSDLTKEQAASILTAWRDHAKKGQGSVVVTRASSEWKASLSVWGPAPNDAWLMREVKLKLDPKGIFNPGRFIDGI
jgi:glycolate oxidase FAD binding subunit